MDNLCHLCLIRNMHVLREIRHIQEKELLLTLPSRFWGHTVEVIVLSLPDEPMPPKKTSMYGCLHQYAIPALIPHEENAWAQAVQEDYENS
jgi:hypothetical protein